MKLSTFVFNTFKTCKEYDPVNKWVQFKDLSKDRTWRLGTLTDYGFILDNPANSRVVYRDSNWFIHGASIRKSIVSGVLLTVFTRDPL